MALKRSWLGRNFIVETVCAIGFSPHHYVGFLFFALHPPLRNRRLRRPTASYTTHLTPLILHHSADTTHLTPLLLLHSSYTTHHTPLIIHQSSYSTHLIPLTLHICKQCATQGRSVVAAAAVYRLGAAGMPDLPDHAVHPCLDETQDWPRCNHHVLQVIVLATQDCCCPSLV